MLYRQSEWLSFAHLLRLYVYNLRLYNRTPPPNKTHNNIPTVGRGRTLDWLPPLLPHLPLHRHHPRQLRLHARAPLPGLCGVPLVLRRCAPLARALALLKPIADLQDRVRQAFKLFRHRGV